MSRTGVAVRAGKAVNVSPEVDAEDPEVDREEPSPVSDVTVVETSTRALDLLTRKEEVPDSGRTCTRGGTVQEDPELVVLHGSEVGFDAAVSPRYGWRRQDEVDCWSCCAGGDYASGMVRPPTAEQLLSPADGDNNSFKMWMPAPSGDRQSHCRL